MFEVFRVNKQLQNLVVRQNDGWFQYALTFASVMLAFAAAAEIGLAIPLSQNGLSLFWPPAAVSLTSLLLFGSKLWPAIFVSDLAINLLHGYPLSLSLGTAAATTVGPLVGATLLKHLGDFRPSLRRLRDVVAFILLGAITGCVAGAAFWIAYRRIVLGFPIPRIIPAGFMWARGDIVSIVVLGPALLVWSQRFPTKLQFIRLAEAAATLSSLVVVDWLVFHKPLLPSDAYEGEHFAFPFIIWLALRFGIRGGTLGLIATSYIAIWSTVHDKGPFAHDVFGLQLFLTVIAFTALIVAAVISEREQMEADLRRNQEQLGAREERYRDLFENAEDFIVTFDLNGYFTSANQAVLRATEYTLEEFLKLKFLDIIASASQESAWSAFKDLMSGEKPAHRTAYEIVCKGGRNLWVEVNSRPLTKDGAVIGVQSIGRDVSWRKRMEQELLQAQKMEAIGRLAGGVAHDFNNLLSVIIGYSDLILFELPGDDGLQHKIEEIRQAGKRAAEVARQLLAFSRKQLLQPKIVDLSSIVAETRRMLLRLLGENIELISKLSPTDTRVKTDPYQMQQMILNLAINARDAMPNGGLLMVETFTVQLRRADGRNMFEQLIHRQVPIVPGSYVVLAVTDTGVGMDDQTKSRIFEPFFTTKPEGEGTGLGLSTVYGFVKQSGGYILVHSEPGRGTTFKIYLPQISSPVGSPEHDEPLTPLPRGSETILLVEDQESLRQLNRELMKSLGYTVLQAGHGAEALERAARHSGRIDLLVADVVMPGLSGRELAERLLLSRPEMKVLYMSGYNENVIVHHGIPSFGAEFLQKPFTRDVLARKLREVLGPAEEKSDPEAPELIDCHSSRSTF